MGELINLTPRRAERVYREAVLAGRCPYGMHKTRCATCGRCQCATHDHPYEVRRGR